MPVVSVLMPCYNAAGTVAEALQSLQRQTLADFEVICVDDGSSDATAELVEAWAMSDPRFKVIHQEHAGIVTALNAGLRLCRAPYVARMDADDRSHPERLMRQAVFLDSHPDVDLVSCRVSSFPANAAAPGFAIYIDWLNGLLSDMEIRREIFIESPLPHPSVTFRRDVILNIGGYQEHGWAEDYDLWLRMLIAGSHFTKLPETLLEWRERPDRLTRTDTRYSLENFLRAKAYYLAKGPLQGREAVFIWGSGMTGRRLGRQLLRLDAPLKMYFDIDPRKIGRTRHGRPILAPAELLENWRRYQQPILLAAVGARKARPLIRQYLDEVGLVEGQDWWSVA